MGAVFGGFAEEVKEARDVFKMPPQADFIMERSIQPMELHIMPCE
jgi:hypothetical protein